MPKRPSLERLPRVRLEREERKRAHAERFGLEWPTPRPLVGPVRARDVKEAEEEEEAPAEPSPLPAADVKEPVALAPGQALKPVQRLCEFLEV